MIDQLVTVGLSNTCFALVLAIVAMLVGARAERPHLAHLLWLLVLAKLVTPPLVSIPVDLLPLSPESVRARLPLDEAAFNAPLETLLGELNSQSSRITCPPDVPPTGDGKRSQQRRIIGAKIQHDDFKQC